MILKHGRDRKEEFLKIENFLVEQVKELERLNQYGYIKTIIIYLENCPALTFEDLIIIFEKVSTTTTNMAMTIAEQIRETTTIQHIQGMWNAGIHNVELIAKSLQVSIQKVEEIIHKIRESNK